MAGTSKTARASSRAASGRGAAKFIPAADASILISLGGGSHVRVHSPIDGKATKLAVGDAALVELLASFVAEGHGDKLDRELAALADKHAAWAAVVEQLAAPSVEDAEAEELAAA